MSLSIPRSCLWFSKPWMCYKSLYKSLRQMHKCNLYSLKSVQISLHHLHTGCCSFSPLFFATQLKLTQVTWRSTHKFSFGLSSGLQDIKIVVFKPFLCSFVLYAWGRWCAGTHIRFSSRISLYFTAFIYLRFTLTSLPGPSAEKHPPPCFTVRMLCFWWCGVFDVYNDGQKAQFWSGRVSRESSSSWSPTYLLEKQ